MPPRLRRYSFYLIAGLASVLSLVRQSPAQCFRDQHDGSTRALYEQRDWSGIVQRAEEIHPRSADLNFDFGMALAHLARWNLAQKALETGHRQCPHQKRFDLELAGVFFQLKQYTKSAVWVRRGLKLDPQDSYANDLAGTTYFLTGNLGAALKYWNRIQKPYVSALRFGPQLHVERLLLDRTVAFSPASILKYPEFATTVSRLSGLGIFPVYNIALRPEGQGEFNVDINAIEKNEFGASSTQALVATFSGAWYETIYPSYFNIRRSAINLESLLRWDTQKRRVWLSYSAPLRDLAQWRIQFTTDERNENWSIRQGFTGPAAEFGSLNLEREKVTGSLTSLHSSSLQWSIGGDLSHRAYRDVLYGLALTPGLTLSGFQLKQIASIQTKVLDIPERRLTLNAGGESAFGRIWSTPPQLFEKLQGSSVAHWYPQAGGGELEVEARVRAGWTFGNAPFDELYMLGIERDNDLWLRGEIGIRDGRKGSSPLGVRYFLSNLDLQRRVYDNGLLKLKAGPLFDVGKASAPNAYPSSNRWIFNPGAEARINVLGTNLVVSFGRDLHAGTNAFFASVVR